jgi:tRNA nucleotidyltransferase (CCA-adding enzyme)
VYPETEHQLPHKRIGVKNRPVTKTVEKLGGKITMLSAIEPKWEHFAHDADIGIRGTGPSMEQSFEQAALAMTAVITDPAKIRLEQKVNITCEAPDEEMLLVGWLNSLLYEMATRHMLFGRLEVFINKNRLSALAWGEKVDILRHAPTIEVKGATYTSLIVKEDEHRQWTAQCVVDV